MIWVRFILKRSFDVALTGDPHQTFFASLKSKRMAMDLKNYRSAAFVISASLFLILGFRHLCVVIILCEKETKPGGHRWVAFSAVDVWPSSVECVAVCVALYLCCVVISHTGAESTPELTDNPGPDVETRDGGMYTYSLTNSWGCEGEEGGGGGYRYTSFTRIGTKQIGATADF